MKSMRRISSLLLMPLFLLSCGKEAALSNAERLHKAYLDSIEATEDKIRPLVNLLPSDERLIWNESKDRVLLFSLHRFPSSYPEGETVTNTWGDAWLCSLKEYKQWYLDNKSNIADPLLRTKQVLGMDESSKNTYISSMWFDPADVIRPAYVTDPTKPMKTSFEENATDEYKAWFSSQYYYSYDVAHLPWTRLGYTYDWSAEAKDRYGLSEFLSQKGTTFVVDKTMLVTDWVKTF